MLIIHYIKEGMAFSDFDLLREAEVVVNAYHEGRIQEISVSTANIIEAIRVLVCRGEIEHDEVVIHFKEDVIKLNEKIEFSHYPIGFMDWEQKFLSEILIKKLKEFKKEHVLNT